MSRRGIATRACATRAGSHDRAGCSLPWRSEFPAVPGTASGQPDRAPIASESRRTYLSKVRQYLAWLADAALDGDPLTMLAARDWAVRDYRTHLQAVAKRAPRTVNNALAAVDDFYTRLGLGAANATRADLPAPRPGH